MGLDLDFCKFFADIFISRAFKLTVVFRICRYYCLVAACVLFQRWTWIRNVSLAGALLLPGIAAVHAIVLASVHRESAF